MKLEIRKVLQFLYIFIIKTRIQFIGAILNVSKPAAINLCKSIRKRIHAKIQEHDDMIGGTGIIVEIDESKFVKRKYHKGLRVEGAWVLGGV